MKRFLAPLLALLGLGSAAQAQPAASGPEVMKELRAKALATTPEALGLPRKDFADRPWGILMETGLKPGVVYSVVAFADGSTSVYFSTGGGMIGGAGQPPIKAAGLRLVGAAAGFQGHANATTVTELPEPGMVTFYFLTQAGTLSYSAPQESLGTGKDKLSPLFHAGHEVITEWRKLEESRGTSRRQ